MCIVFKDSTYKWYHMIFVFLWLTSLDMVISRSFHGALNGMISFFFVAEQYSIPYMPHVFVHSSVDGHLGCLHVLAIASNAAVNIGVHVSYRNVSLFGCAESLFQRVGSFIAVCGLSSCGPWALHSWAQELLPEGSSCSLACGILVSWPGIEPVFPVLRQILSHWTTRETPHVSSWTLSGSVSRNGIAGSMVTLLLVFWGTAI